MGLCVQTCTVVKFCDLRHFPSMKLKHNLWGLASNDTRVLCSSMSHIAVLWQQKYFIANKARFASCFLGLVVFPPWNSNFLTSRQIFVQGWNQFNFLRTTQSGCFAGNPVSLVPKLWRLKSLFFNQTVFKSGLVNSTKKLKNCSKTLLRYIASGWQIIFACAEWRKTALV